MSLMKSKTVPGILAEGRSWVERLDKAADETAKVADDLADEALRLQQQSNDTRKVADEGKTVAESFKSMLYPNPE